MAKDWYPLGQRMQIPVGSSDPEIIPVGVILHVDAGNSSSLRRWFSGPSGGIESHGFIRKDGTFEQYRAFGREADAQLGGNSWTGPDGKRYGFISVETQGFNLGAWNRVQKGAIKTFLLWASKEFGFPLVVVRNANPINPGQGGVGYHSMKPAWNSLKKTCPGPRRIKWFKTVLVPWMDEVQRGPRVRVANAGDTWEALSKLTGVPAIKLVWLNRPGPQPGEKIKLRRTP